jgi:hypothetical protein
MSTIKRLREENQMLRQKVRAMEAELRRREPGEPAPKRKRSLRQLSHLSGLPVTTIHYRACAGVPDWRLTVRDGFRQGRGRALHEFRGGRYTVYRIAKMTGLSESRLRHWLNKGKGITDIIDGGLCKR